MQRKYLFYFFFIVIGFIFTARLFYIQILNEEYKLSALNNVIRKEKVYPGRGLVYDRKGRLLIGNQSAYDLMVIPSKIKIDDTLAFCKLLVMSKSELITKIKKAKRYSYLKPSTFMKQISKSDFAYIQEQLHLYPGFYPQKRILRDYNYISGANVLGFIGEASPAFIKENPQYQQGDLIGKTGIEKSYERELKGKTGVNYNLVDVHNRSKGVYENGDYDTLPNPGFDIQTTIDIALQTYGELLMNGKRGSIVAIEPKTGEILALVSSPSYNPELMTGRDRTRNYSRLYLDSINKPLYDRGLLAEYPPGSPFKVINALIGLQEGTLTPNTTHTCHHGFHYGRLHVACHCGTNYPIALRSGIAKSCNNYFCQVFRDIIGKYPTAQEGMDTWSKHVKSFNLGRFLNNDLPTGRRGLVPNADYYDDAFGYTGWKAVSTISLAIGQGELVLTPIQMANMTAAIANKGYYYTPHIVKGIGGKPIEDPNFTEPKYTTIDSAHFNVVIEGMFDVFETGTARYSRLEGIQMCGKTGTAENPHGQDHSIFVAFAPKDNPQIAISIIVENGYWGSRWAAPIASLMIEKYLSDTISRPQIELKMLQGDLTEEYDKQLEKLYGKIDLNAIADETE